MTGVESKLQESSKATFIYFTQTWTLLFLWLTDIRTRNMTHNTISLTSSRHYFSTLDHRFQSNITCDSQTSPVIHIHKLSPYNINSIPCQLLLLIPPSSSSLLWPILN